jgi:hypothetical protein
MWTLVDGLVIARRVREVNRVRRAAVFARHRIVEGTALPVTLGVRTGS